MSYLTWEPPERCPADSNDPASRALTRDEGAPGESDFKGPPSIFFNTFLTSFLDSVNFFIQ